MNNVVWPGCVSELIIMCRARDSDRRQLILSAVNRHCEGLLGGAGSQEDTCPGSQQEVRVGRAGHWPTPFWPEQVVKIR